ncbi:MAG: DinB family protein [Bacteroidota bacterium]
MSPHFENLRATRQKFIHFLEALSLEDLNKIPANFNNNIFWNIAHAVVTQQLLTYRMTGLEGYVDQTYIDWFRKGTKPESPYGQEHLIYVKEQITELINRTAQDYKNKVFGAYRTYQTSYGVTLNSIEDAIVFNNMHEALHLGYVMAQRKAIAI